MEVDEIRRQSDGIVRRVAASLNALMHIERITQTGGDVLDKFQHLINIDPHTAREVLESSLELLVNSLTIHLREMESETVDLRMPSEEEVAEFLRGQNEIAERAVAMLQEQAASGRIDIEAAEDFAIWVDSKADLPKHAYHMIPNDEGLQWVLYVAFAAGRTIKAQAGNSDDPAAVEKSRSIEHVRDEAQSYADYLARALQDEDTE